MNCVFIANVLTLKPKGRSELVKWFKEQFVDYWKGHGGGHLKVFALEGIDVRGFVVFLAVFALFFIVSDPHFTPCTHKKCSIGLL